VHDAKVDDSPDVVVAKDVLELLSADIELDVMNVLGPVDERSPVDADDRTLTVQDPSEALAEAAADARDEDGRTLRRAHHRRRATARSRRRRRLRLAIYHRLPS
jgi:hypothetical protein